MIIVIMIKMMMMMMVKPDKARWNDIVLRQAKVKHTLSTEYNIKYGYSVPFSPFLKECVPTFLLFHTN